MHTACSRRAHVLDADVAVVTQGPGNLGTGTRWGFSGVAAGEARERRRRPERPPGRVAAGLRRGPATAAPRRLAPLADRLRPGGADAGGRRVPDLAAIPWHWALAASGRAAGRRRLVAPVGRHRAVQDAVDGLMAALSRLPGAAVARWAAAWTTTPPPSWPRPPPGGTPPHAARVTPAPLTVTTIDH